MRTHQAIEQFALCLFILQMTAEHFRHVKEYGIIDIEGCWLKSNIGQSSHTKNTNNIHHHHPPHHHRHHRHIHGGGKENENKIQQTLVASELSCVFVKNNSISGGFSYRLSYDIRHLYNANRKTLTYLKHKFPNTFRNRLCDDRPETITANECRKRVLEIAARIPLYAKGNLMESAWIYHPEVCDGRFDDPTFAINNVKRIGEIQDYVKKYDLIEDKYETVLNNIYKINEQNITDKFLLRVENVNHHYSLYECIVFASEIIKQCNEITN